MDGVSVAKWLHHFVEATSLCKAPFPNQRDLSETAMGHGGPWPDFDHCWKSKSQGTISKLQRICREIWRCLSWDILESMNHLSHLSWESQSSKLCKTILRNYTGMGQNRYLYKHHIWGNSHPLPRVSRFWLTGHMIQMWNAFTPPTSETALRQCPRTEWETAVPRSEWLGLTYPQCASPADVSCMQWKGERLKESIPNVKQLSTNFHFD